MDNKEILENVETKETKENKGISFRGTTELLSFILGGLITYDLFKLDFFICDNWAQIILVAVFCTFSIYAMLFKFCKFLVKYSKND